MATNKHAALVRHFPHRVIFFPVTIFSSVDFPHRAELLSRHADVPSVYRCRRPGGLATSVERLSMEPNMD